jgi:hypothetical protein
VATTLDFSFEFRNKRFKDAESGFRAFAQAIKQNWEGSAKVLSAELREFLDGVADALAQRHGGAWPGGTTTNTLSRRSGAMVQSIVESVQVNGRAFDKITGQIGGSMIAAMQEFGATITPKTAKYLTVPLPAALDSKGLPRKKSAREWDNTFVARSKAGNLIIFQRDGAKIVPLFVLKTSVTIPPRLGMRKTLDTGIPYFVERAMDALVRELMKGSQ